MFVRTGYVCTSLTWLGLALGHIFQKWLVSLGFFLCREAGARRQPAWWNSRPPVNTLNMAVLRPHHRPRSLASTQNVNGSTIEISQALEFKQHSCENQSLKLALCNKRCRGQSSLTRSEQASVFALQSAVPAALQRQHTVTHNHQVQTQRHRTTAPPTIFLKWPPSLIPMLPQLLALPPPPSADRTRLDPPPVTAQRQTPKHDTSNQPHIHIHKRRVDSSLVYNHGRFSR